MEFEEGVGAVHGSFLYICVIVTLASSFSGFSSVDDPNIQDVAE